MFLTIVLGVWTVMHLYVFWRAASVPAVAGHLSRGALLAIAAFLWVSYPLARLLDHWRLGLVARPLEFAGTTWMGVLFLAFAVLLVLDVVTLGGFLLPRLAPTLRGWALGGRGRARGRRAGPGASPAGRRATTRCSSPGSPPSATAPCWSSSPTCTSARSSARRWMARLVDRVEAMKPDLIVVDGDLIDGNVARVEPMVPVLRRLAAPLGVWAVTGNHEFYAGLGEEREAVRGGGLPRAAGPLGRGRPRPRARRRGRPHRPAPVRPRRRAGPERARGPPGRRHRAALAHAVAGGRGGRASAPA